MKISWIEIGAIAGGEIPINREEVLSLKEQGIRAIVTLTEYELTWLEPLKAMPFAELDIELLHIPVADTHPPTREQIETVFAFVNRMRQEKKPVYIHCEVGVGRTGTMLHALYLLSGLSFNEVKDKIGTARPLSHFDELTDSQRLFLQQLAADLNL